MHCDDDDGSKLMLMHPLNLFLKKKKRCYVVPNKLILMPLITTQFHKTRKKNKNLTVHIIIILCVQTFFIIAGT